MLMEGLKRFCCFGAGSGAALLITWLGTLSLPQALLHEGCSLSLSCFKPQCTAGSVTLYYFPRGWRNSNRYLRVAYIDLFLLAVVASLHCFSSFPGCLYLAWVLCHTVVPCIFSIFGVCAVARAEGSITCCSVTSAPLTWAELGRNKVRKEEGSKLHVCSTATPPLTA